MQGSVIVVMLLSAALTIVGVAAYSYGSYSFKEGQRSVLVQIEEARAATAGVVKEISNEIDDLTTDDLLLRALSYVRDTPDNR